MSEPLGPGEGALRASEARFRALFDRAPIGLALVDPHGRILAANTALQEILGYDEQDLRRMTFAEITHPDDVPADWILFREVLAGTRDTYSMDKRYLRKDGGIVRGHLAVSVTRDQDGALQSMIGMLLDITERKEVEAALRAAEERYRQIEEHAPIGLALQAPDGHYLRVNPALCALIGYTEEELLARTFGDITHPDDLGADLAQLRRMLAGETATYQTEKRYVRKDSTVVWALISVSLVRGEDGRPAYFIAQMQDIGARKEAERALEQARAAAEDLAAVRQGHAEEAEAMAAVGAALASSLEPLQLYQVILEQSARILPCDHAGVTLYARGQATFFATWGEPRIPPGFSCPMPALWLPEAGGGVSSLADADADPTWQAIPPLVGPYRARSVLSAPLTIDGTVLGSFWVSSRTPGFYAERHRRLAAVFADRATQALRNARLYAAEQERTRAAKALAQLRTDFLASVSHELRTPLTAIIGFGELLQARWEQFSEAQRLQRINHIVQAASRQQRLVQDLLLIGRIENASLSPKSATLALAPLVEHAVAEVQGSYPGQAIVLEGPPDLRVRADAAHLTQVLVNLLDNAAKYSPDGSPIAVRWGPEGEMVALRVADRGPGVPEEGREQLFTRFGRLPGSRIRSGRVGTGLGLHISRGLAEAMGGDLDLEATGPEGSTFRLRLPSGQDQAALPDVDVAPG